MNKLYLASFVHFTSPGCWMKGAPIRSECLLTDATEAIKWAVSSMISSGAQMDWANFPDPAKQYPYEDRDGSNTSLRPLFRATHADPQTGERWTAQVVVMEPKEQFDWAGPRLLERTEAVIAAWAKAHPEVKHA